MTRAPARASVIAARPDELSQPPIQDYALIGDCRTAALVSRTGSIDWLCLPHYSSPSIFAHLLDHRRGGRFSIRPVGAFRTCRQYLGETPALATEFQTNSGSARVIDVLPVVDGMHGPEPTREILRVVEGISGEVEMEIRIEPRPDYARRTATIRHSPRLGWRFGWSNEFLAVRTDAELEHMGDGALGGRLRVRAGQRRYVSLCYSQADPGVLSPLGGAADQRLEHTLTWWRDWSRNCSYDGPYRATVLRSALTLKLLSFCLSGAIIAAPTTSLPESLAGDRNWDYRYCWLRDAGLTMQALLGLAFHGEARQFLHWLLHATRLTWPELQIMYDVYGLTQLGETELSHLEGYRGARPVRIGNGAYAQRQLDVYGEVVFAADAYVNSGGLLEPVERRLLAGIGQVVCRQWREADHGIWEVRGPPRHHTFSKMMCWLALDRLLNLDEKGAISLGSLAEPFRRERQAIAEAIEQRGFNPEIASYASEFGGDRVDASLLLMPCFAYRPANDPRVLSTYQRIRQRLERNGLLYRYELGSDGLGGDEGTFGICSFWAAHHLASRGDVAGAKSLFEHVLSFANDVGLFAEEINPETGDALGNFPQAFTHIGLINAALAIEQADKR
jgi:GH15 family glucan-1,4-alpha-glucosidase